MTKQAKSIISKARNESEYFGGVNNENNHADVPSGHRCWSSQTTQHYSWVYCIHRDGSTSQADDAVNETSNSNAGIVSINSTGYSIGQLFANDPTVAEVVVITDYWNGSDSRFNETHAKYYQR